MNIPHWHDAPEVWDVATFLDGGTRYPVPGLCTLRPSKGLEVTSEPVAGQDGVQQTALRYRPAEVQMDVRVFDAAQFTQLLRIIALWRPSKGKEAKAIIVTHPQMQMLGIRELFISSVETHTPDASSGFLASFNLIEFTPEDKRQGRTVQEVAAPRADANAGNARGEGEPLVVGEDIPSLRALSGLGIDSFLPPSEAAVPVEGG